MVQPIWAPLSPAACQRRLHFFRSVVAMLTQRGIDPKNTQPIRPFRDSEPEVYASSKGPSAHYRVMTEAGAATFNIDDCSVTMLFDDAPRAVKFSNGKVFRNGMLRLFGDVKGRPSGRTSMKQVEPSIEAVRQMVSLLNPGVLAESVEAAA